MRICIDAGHGGRDPGAVGLNSSREKDIVLNITRNIKRIVDGNKQLETVIKDDIERVSSRRDNPETIAFLEQRFGGINNYLESQQERLATIKYLNNDYSYTRLTDIFIALGERVNISQRQGADMFISLHCNAAINRLATGTETFFFKGNEEGKILSEYINNEIISVTGWRNRGVKTTSVFRVLRGYNQQIPACLVEFNFISNPEMEQILNNITIQNKMAICVLEGIDKFIYNLD